MRKPTSIVAGVVLLALVAGCSGAPPPTTAPAATVAATQLPVTTPTLAPTASPTLAVDPNAARPCTDQHSAGRVSLTPEQSLLSLPVSLTFPEGWSGCGLAFKGQRRGLPAMMVGFWPLEYIYPDPCHWKRADRQAPFDPFEATLAQARSPYIEYEDHSSHGVTIDGIRATAMELRVPLDADVSDCDASGEREFRLWDGPGGGDGAVWWLPAPAAPGLIAMVYFLEADGEQIGIQTVRFADSPEPYLDVADELAAIVASIDFQQ